MNTTKKPVEFKVKVRKVQAATCYKAALFDVEYAPGVSTNVYAADKAEALRKVCGA